MWVVPSVANELQYRRKGQAVNTRITIAELIEAKRAGRKFAAVSCYDYTTARLVAETGVEMILVGDSAAEVLLGHDSTLPVTMDFMVTITAAVKRAAPGVCLVADMPFLSYQTGWQDAVKNAGRFITEGGVQLIKVEVGEPHIDIVKAMSDAGMGVMAHIGIKPQTVGKMGKLRVEGDTVESAATMLDLADTMVEAGAVALLLEGTTREAAKMITQRVPVPVVGCGAGPDCDGQILVISDILGLTRKEMPRFAKKYTDTGKVITAAVAKYAAQVRAGKFPDDKHSYHVRKSQAAEFAKWCKQQAQ
jgi:3-methyl-2-oxobutanoate hydroxymethyltransferase